MRETEHQAAKPGAAVLPVDDAVSGVRGHFIELEKEYQRKLDEEANKREMLEQHRRAAELREQNARQETQAAEQRLDAAENELRKSREKHAAEVVALQSALEGKVLQEQKYRANQLLPRSGNSTIL